MKHLFTLIIFSLALINVSFSQSSIANADSYFVQNKVGEKLNHFYTTEGKVQVYFHKDRIEMISEFEGEEQYFFIMLKNVSFELPEGEGLVSRELVDIENESMASVLKSRTMEKSYFKSIRYTERNSGDVLEISMKGNKIDFNGIGKIPIELELWGNAGMTSTRSNNVQLEEFGKIIELSSNNSQLTKDNDKISFKQSGGNDNASLNFSITIN